jgi:hypothetical protein
MEDLERRNEQQVPESEESLVSDAERDAAEEAAAIGGKGGVRLLLRRFPSAPT